MSFLPPNPIPVLQSLGYTEREAAFLYLVGAHSGYFLRRQFDYFIDRNKGSIAMRFLAKARNAGHVESLDYKQGWQVYHLYSRPIYRLFGDAESQLRRRKGDAYIRARLMALDYLLENEGNHFLASGDERVHFFGSVRNLSPDLFEREAGSLQSVLSAMPIGLADRQHPAQSLVRFVFVNEGMVTMEKFLHFLSLSRPLLRAVGNFELVYVSNSEANFSSARAAFWRYFSTDAPHRPGLFADGYRAPSEEYSSLLQPRFTTALLPYKYPTIQRLERQGFREGS
jgi:hypothetical protein